MSGSDRRWHALAGEEVLGMLGTDAERGLSGAEAASRLQRHGRNVLPRGGGPGPFRLLWRQVNNPIGWLLVAAGILALALGKTTDSVVVFGAVGVNALIGFFQEYRAAKAIEALSSMIPETATVLRDGHPTALDAGELAPGDVVTLQGGDKVPADLRLFRVRNLTVDESALTGESLPVTKRPDPVSPEAPLGDRLGMAYSGTLVSQGTATGVVVATGGGTELGRIHALLREARQLETPLTRQLARVTTGITAAVVAVVAVLLVVGIRVRQVPVAESLMLAVSLAVAAIPEGLPAVVTICLAIGVRRMAARNAVVRHLPAVETLGSTSVICSDKTGTLTRNEMTVQVAWVDGREYRFSGVGYAPVGEVEHDGIRLREIPGPLRELLSVAVLCNDASLRQEGDAWIPTGDPTEAALLVAARKAGLDDAGLRRLRERIDAVPFESEAQYMATLNRHEGGSRILLKGATETVLDRCAAGEAERSAALAATETYAREGMRVIAFARSDDVPLERISPGDVSGGLRFRGLLCMIDPPRTEAVDAIRACRAAGIEVKMITGDHPVTAEAIGRLIGLLGPGESALRGAELERLSGVELEEAALRTRVFARVAPEHKIRIVEALQARGRVVAMTGDGVNDAPALRRADIGIAMGITGTAVSREAAKVVLADDNFASIAAAVEEGRRVYDNLVKSLAFLLPTNLGLALTLSVSMFFFPTVSVEGVPELLMAMSPSQTLWINLFASVTLSVPLAFEVLEPDAMRRPPRAPEEPVFPLFLVVRLVLVAVVMSGAACGLFLWEYYRIAGPGPVPAALHAYALSEAQTLCVTGIALTQVFYLLDCRSQRHSFLKQGAFRNPAVLAGIGLLLLLQACFSYLPPLQRLFSSSPLDGKAWAAAALAGAAVMPVVWLHKRIRRG